MRNNPVELILLDVMLPGKSGLDLCREIRTFSDAAIIMVTARVEEIDRLLGLELGADDYICKPFSPREVVARVATVLRRTRRAQTSAPKAGGLVLDESGWRATLDGKALDLTAVEFKLLSVLASQRGGSFRATSSWMPCTAMSASWRTVPWTATSRNCAARSPMWCRGRSSSTPYTASAITTKTGAEPSCLRIPIPVASPCHLIYICE